MRKSQFSNVGATSHGVLVDHLAIVVLTAALASLVQNANLDVCRTHQIQPHQAHARTVRTPTQVLHVCKSRGDAQRDQFCIHRCQKPAVDISGHLSVFIELGSV